MDYNPSTTIGYVRLLISDTSREQESLIFSDAEIQAVLTAEGHPKIAAAQLLDLIADNEALLGKVVRSNSISTDGAKVADSLRKHAESLRSQGWADLDAVSGASAVVEFSPSCESGHAELAEYRFRYA